MIQYSFIQESFNKLVKRLSRYNPKERKRITERLIKLGKKNGGLYSPEEYGEKMINGQINRIKKLAKDNNREIVFQNIDSARSNIMVPTSIRTIKKPSKTGWDKDVNKEELFTYRNSIRGKDVASLPLKDKSLLAGDITSHEADEYSRLFLNAKRLKISPSELGELTNLHNKQSLGSHNIGVLKRELKRNQKLNSIYNYKLPIERSNKELSNDSVKLNHLLKYQDYLSPKIKDWINKSENPYLNNLLYLKNQRNILEKLLNDKRNIVNMKDSLRKSIKLQKLRNEFEFYNNHIDSNRKRLKIDF